MKKIILILFIILIVLVGCSNDSNVKTEVTGEKISDLLNLYSVEFPVTVEVNQKGVISYLLINIYKDHNDKPVFTHRYSTGILLLSEKGTEIRKGVFSCSWIFNSYLMKNKEHNYKILNLSYFGTNGEKEPLNLKPYFKDISVTSKFKFPKKIKTKLNQPSPFAIMLGNRENGIIIDYNPYETDIKELIKSFDLVFVMSYLQVSRLEET